LKNASYNFPVLVFLVHVFLMLDGSPCEA